MFDPLDSQGKYINWMNGQPYSNERGLWASKWSTFPLYSNQDKLLELVSAFENADVTILVSGTGSGKTVLAIPLMLKTILSSTASNSASVVATMPKRATVISAAYTGSRTLDVPLGTQVGYRYRDSDKEHANNSQSYQNRPNLLYATDGYVLAQSRRDPNLSDFDAVIIDEAHERGVPSDMLMLAVIYAQKSRRHQRTNPIPSHHTRRLRLVVMSATIDPIPLQEYFFRQLGKQSVIRTVHVSGGSFYPVEMKFLPKPSLNPVQEAFDTAVNLINHEGCSSGKVLVFVPTTKDASGGCDTFRLTCQRSKSSSIPLSNMAQQNMKQNEKRIACAKAECATLYGKQTKEQQLSALDASNSSNVSDKHGFVIVATNVAESSLTITNVRHVVDSGLQIVNRWLPTSHASKLGMELASRAQISQRIGRTGRTGPGIAHLMYTQEQFNAQPDYPLPSILSTDLTDHIFGILCSTPGIRTFQEASNVLMQLLTPPTQDQIKGAEQVLLKSGLIDDNYRLTILGRRCYALSLMTRMDVWNALIVAHASITGNIDLVQESLDLVAILETVSQGIDLWWDPQLREPTSVPNMALIKMYGGDRRSDHISLIQVYRKIAFPAFSNYELDIVDRGRSKKDTSNYLMQGAWTSIVKRSRELGRGKIIKRCIKLFKNSSILPGDIKSYNLSHAIKKARIYHKIENGKSDKVQMNGKQQKISYDTWFVDPKYTLSNCHYEFMVFGMDGSARINIITAS